MFTYFHDRKLKYNKGQLAPFFIVIMVAIVIMALVTVNLSKVALTKTESANSADAGALAAGSVMANVFNSIAKQNAVMEFQFWSSFTAISVSFTVAVGSLGFALATGCTSFACAGAAAANVAWWTIVALGIAVTALKVAQYLTYQTIRDKIAKKGRESAVKAGHQFVFINSGIGSKLKEGGQRDDFKNFMDNTVEHAPTYTYSWQDGQGRGHSVESTVTIDPVNKFEMQTTLEPALLISASLISAGWLAGKGANVPGLALACWWSTCCCPLGLPPQCAVCCTNQITACMAAMPFLIGAIAALAVAWAGLTPTGPIIEEEEDGGIVGAATSLWIYAWIDDIDHDRKVEVRTKQHHGEADLGLWKAAYPDTFSSSRVDFKGNGDIHPPKLRHDSSIEAVDFP